MLIIETIRMVMYEYYKNAKYQCKYKINIKINQKTYLFYTPSAANAPFFLCAYE